MVIRGGSKGLEETNVTAILKKKKNKKQGQGGGSGELQGLVNITLIPGEMREQVFLGAISKHIMD